MSLLRPRSIRGQFMAALILFELLVVGIFALLLLHQQRSEMTQRTHRRLETQGLEMASLAALAIEDPRDTSLTRVVQILSRSSSVNAAQIT
ncbi:MAG: hypothetical protein ACLGXA_11915, partial [Acidobacteriota bacterium]